MFARVTTFHVKIHRLEDAINIYRESVLPAAREQKGYRGASLMTNPKTGKCVAIAYWDKEEDAIANEKNMYYQEQLIKFMKVLLISPVRDGYEVNIADRIEVGKKG